MLKKYMIFGSVVLLLAALLTVTGCSQATDSDGTTLVIGENHLFGTADQAAVKRAVDSAKRTGRSVVISDGTWLTSSGALPGVADFENLPVRVEGSVTVSDGVIVNAARANLTFAEGAYITVRAAGAFIYQGGDEKKIGTDPATPGFKVRYVTDALMGTQGTDRHVAISDYTITNNYRTLIAPHITNLYVLDKLTIDAGSIKAPGDGTDANSIGPDSSPRVIALGTVALEASNSLVFGALSPESNHFQFTSSAVLTSTVPSLTLTLSQGRATLPTIDAAVPLTIQRDGPINILTIDKIQGPAPLTITNGANTFGRLIIGEVVEGAQVAVGTGGIFGVANGGLEITKNAGSVSLSAPASLANKSKIEVGTNTNTGTITISAELTAADGVEVSVGDNSGTLNIDTAVIGSTNTPVPPYYPGVYIAKNTGEVNFVKSLTVSTLKGIRAPVNNGAINFYGTFTSTAAAPLGDAVPANFLLNIGGGGKLVFGGLAAFGADTNIDCNMEFNAGFTQATDTDLGLGGDVTLANGQSIKIYDGAAPGSVPSTTLKEGKKLLVGDVPVLVGGAAGAIIKPAGGGTVANYIHLTAGIRIPDEDDDLGYKTLVLRSGDDGTNDFVGIASIDGELRVAGTGLLFNENTIETATGSLTLEDGAILLLPETDNTVTLGTTTNNDAKIAGLATPPGTQTYYPTAYPAPVQFVATGGAVSLGSNKISGSGASLASPEDSETGPVISVGAATGGKGLIIAGINLDLQFAGTLTIVGNTSGSGNYVTLEAGANPGKITLSDDTGTTYGGSLGGTGIDLNANDTFNPASDIALSGTGVLLGDSETLPCAIGTISGAPNGRLTLTGLSTAASIAATVAAGIGNTVVGP